MSVNRYDASTGELTNIASGQRTWVGTQAAYKAAKQAGTLPNNAIIAITDDEVDHNHYSTDEVETGMYWIDGKPIYRKVIDCGPLPLSTTKTVSHGVASLGAVVNINGISTNPTGSIPIPYLSISGTTNVILYSTSTDIIIGTNSDLSSFTDTKVIFEYTKSTD